MERKHPKVVDELTQFLGKNIEIKAIQGGALNLSFCVLCDDKRYFLKLFDDSTTALIERSRLFYQQLMLERKGMAPMPLYLSNKNDFQLDQWVDGITLNQSQLSKSEKCQRLAQALHTIHQLDIAIPKLDLEKDWQRYISISNTLLSSIQQNELTELLSFWQQECAELSVVCHNDLSFSHVVETEQNLIFDWEYIAVTSPFFDIASCCKINQLNAHERQILIKEYAQCSLFDELKVKEKVNKMQPIVDKTYELWTKAFV